MEDLRHDDRVVRRGRCQFPGCRCECMQRHATNGMCIRCFHVDAWHERLPGLERRVPLEPRETQPIPEPPRVQSRMDVVEEESLIQNILSSEMKTDRTLCCICLVRHCSSVLKPCGHARFCKECVRSVRGRDGRNAKCPLCRVRITRDIEFVPI